MRSIQPSRFLLATPILFLLLVWDQLLPLYAKIPTQQPTFMTLYPTSRVSISLILCSITHIFTMLSYFFFLP